MLGSAVGTTISDQDAWKKPKSIHDSSSRLFRWNVVENVGSVGLYMIFEVRGTEGVSAKSKILMATYSTPIAGD
jgi:hypothetical protein